MIRETRPSPRELCVRVFGFPDYLKIVSSPFAKASASDAARTFSQRIKTFKLKARLR